MEPKCFRDKKLAADLSKTVEFLKIINDKNRLRIICLLIKEGEKCVCDIWRFFNLPQNLVSHHLKVLKDFKLVSSKRRGLKIIYSVNKKVVQKFLKLLNSYLNGYGR